jgi:hypothetical protein
LKPNKSNRRRKDSPPSAAGKTAGQSQRGRYWFLLWLLPAAAFFAAGKYLEFRQDDPFDSGAYVYSAMRLLEGGRLGIDEQPSAQPGTLLVNVLGAACFGFSETGPQIIQTLLQIAALTAMFFAVGRLYGKAAAVFSVTTAAIYLSSPHLAKFGNTKEQYMIAFMVLAASFWIFYEHSGRKRWLVLTGAALIWPYYFKATGLTIDIAFSVYFLVRGLRGGLGFRRFQQELWLLIGGAAAGLVPLAIFFLWQQQWAMLWNSFPVMVLKAVILADAVVVLFFGLRHLHPLRHLSAWAGRVRGSVWIAGGIVLVAALAFGCVRVYLEARQPGDVLSYLNRLFFVRIPSELWAWTAGFLRMIVRSAGTDSPYVVDSRRIFSFSRQAPIVLRYYASVSLPIAAALASIGTALVRQVSARRRKQALLEDRIVWLLGMWWVLDMAFVWISPHSYEQYYLPLCASGAMTGAYAVWRFLRGLEQSAFRSLYWLGGAIASIAAIGMVWPLVFGFSASPYSGQPYQDPQTRHPVRQRGYWQALQQPRRTELWERIGDYIREHTRQEDTIYVWGWYPGIYVRAQRKAPIPKAFESEMHTQPPQILAGQVKYLIAQFEKKPPVYIVDTRKRHFPFDRPPLELWPVVQTRQGGSVQLVFVPNEPTVIESYERSYRAFLAKQYGPEEAERFDAFKPLREYVMNHYRIVPELSSPYSHVLLERVNKETN